MNLVSLKAAVETEPGEFQETVGTGGLGVRGDLGVLWGPGVGGGPGVVWGWG